MTKIYLWAGAGVILLALAIFEYRSIYNDGKSAGKAEIQQAWDDDKLSIQKAADAAVAAATKARDDALAANEGIQSDYQAQLSAARSLNLELADRLRQYQTRAAAGGGSVPKTGGGSVAPPAPPAPGVGSLDGLLGNALDECYTNRVRYEALIKELTPQL